MPLYDFEEVQAKSRFSLSPTMARRNNISVECLKMGLKLLPSLMQAILDGGEGYREAIGDLLHAHILIVEKEGNILVPGCQNANGGTHRLFEFPLLGYLLRIS
jgi:hypothetical protein